MKGDVSRPNLAIHEDGKFCHACGYTETNNYQKKKEPIVSDLIAGHITALEERGLNEDTCKKYNVRTASFTGNVGTIRCTDEPIKLFPLYEGGRVVRQKVKSRNDKHTQSQRGNTKSTAMFGQHLFNPSERIPVIVTEGEEDAMAMWQMTNLPAVSVVQGAQSAHKDVAANLEWLNGFREVLLCFDNDEPGRKAFDACVSMFEPGKAKRVNLPLKDANDMLLADRGEEVKRCLWNAEIVRPATIVFPKDLREKVLTKPQYGRNYPWASMTKATYGMRLGEVTLIAGGTSMGKTEIIREIISQLLADEIKVGYFQFEQQPEQTVQRFISAALNKRIFLPGSVDWDDDKINAELDKIENSIALYQPESGQVSIESILINIRWLAKAHKMPFFVIDNLKALSTNPVIDGKRVAVHDYASHATSKLVMLAKELNIHIFIVNHLANDKISLQAYVSTSPKNKKAYESMTAEDTGDLVNKPGLTWQTGRMPDIDNIFGGGAIKDLVDFIIVIARNRTSKDETEHKTIRVKFLKTRMDSSYEGYEFKLVYNYDTGHLEEDFTQETNNRTPETKYQDVNDMGVLS